MAANSDGFGNGWEQEFPSWAAEKDKILSAKRDTRLRIVILGPGTGSKDGYPKRVQIRDALNQHDNANEAVFLEDLVSGDGLTPDEALREQTYYLLSADIIFALTVAEPLVTGVLEELAHYRNIIPHFEDITWLFVPRPGGKEAERVQSKTLIWEGVRNFPEDHKLQFNHDEFEDCTKIRDYAATKAATARASAFYFSVIDRTVASRPGSFWERN